MAEMADNLLYLLLHYHIQLLLRFEIPICSNLNQPVILSRLLDARCSTIDCDAGGVAIRFRQIRKFANSQIDS